MAWPPGLRPAQHLGRRVAQLAVIALMRYISAMATIQVREVPEDLYEVLRRRARRAGQSLQAYMHDQVIALARRPTKDEAVEQIESVLERLGGSGPTQASILSDVAAERR